MQGKPTARDGQPRCQIYRCCSRYTQGAQNRCPSAPCCEFELLRQNLRTDARVNKRRQRQRTVSRPLSQPLHLARKLSATENQPSPHHHPHTTRPQWLHLPEASPSAWRRRTSPVSGSSAPPRWRPRLRTGTTAILTAPPTKMPSPAPADSPTRTRRAYRSTRRATRATTTGRSS